VAGSQLARTLDLQLVDDFGFAKRYTRCLQVNINNSFSLKLISNVLTKFQS
jgi:hypothetical protein